MENFSKKWENIWYHYKWRILAGIFALFCVIYTVTEFAMRNNSDVYVTYLGTNVDEIRLEENLFNNFSDIAEDINNDNEKVFDAVSILYSSKLEGDMAFWQRVDLDLANGKSYFYLVDESIFNMLKERGSIIPFNIKEDERTYFIDVTDNKYFEGCFNGKERVYLTVRHEFSNLKGKELLIAENGKKIFEKIIDDIN